MNREEMVEKAARALAMLAPGEDWPSNKALGGHWALGTRDDEYRDGIREQAREVLDAVLPQVTCVAELDALPIGVSIVDNRDRVWTKYQTRAAGDPYHWRTADGAQGARTFARLLADKYGPLTVVWQPEVTS